MRIQHDDKPEQLVKYDKQGRYLFRYNLTEVVIPANEFTPEKTAWECNEVILEGDLKNELKLYINDEAIDVIINSLLKSESNSSIKNTEITQPTPPTLQGQFDSIEAYQAINIAIIAYKDNLTNGEYTRTKTLYAYTPEPEPINGKYYMPATPDMVDAGLFDGVTLLEEMPEENEEETE